MAAAVSASWPQRTTKSQISHHHHQSNRIPLDIGKQNSEISAISSLALIWLTRTIKRYVQIDHEWRQQQKSDEHGNLTFPHFFLRSESSISILSTQSVHRSLFHSLFGHLNI